MKKFFNAFLIFFFVSFPIFSIAEEMLDGVAAVVNSEVITIGEVTDRAKAASLQLGNFYPKSDKLKDLQKKSLDSCIDDMLLEQEARRLNFTISQAELDSLVNDELKRIASAYETRADFLVALSKEGLTEPQLKKRISEEVEREYLVNSLVRHEVVRDVIITDDDIEKYKLDYPQEFEDCNKIRLSHILLRCPDKNDESTQKKIDEKVNLIITRAKAGEDFSKLVKEYSEHSQTVIKDGDLGYISKGEIFPEFDITFDGKVGDLFGPVKTQAGIHILKILDKRTPWDCLHQKRIDEGLKQYIESLRSKSVVKILLN